MSFFVEDKSNSVEHHSLWAEKYRPSKLDNYICSDNIRSVFQDFINRKHIPHILLHGSAGTGKTTLAKILTSNIECDVMYVNASDNTKVEFIRETIKPFAASTGFNPLKVVILDEADFLSASSQASLRNLMETYSSTTRFILTCNYVEKIIDPLCSRSQVFKLEPPSLKDVAVHIKNMLDKESIKYELVDLKKIVQDFYPDVRKIINFIQQSSLDGKLKILQSQGASFDLKNKLIDLLKSAKTNGKSFNEIRQLINDAGTRNFEELYTELYSRIDEYAIGKETLIIIEIAEYVYQSSMVVDKEITFMACIAKVIKTINK